MTRGFFLILLLVPGPALAQNKCVDAKGKVFYQQDPCPGSQRLTLPKPPPQPGLPPPRTEEAQWREIAEMQRCMGDWETVAGRLKESRDEVAALRSRGEDPSQEQDISRQYVNDAMERFLPMCRKHGFEYPRDAQLEQRNTAAAASLGEKIEAMRRELDARSRDAQRTAAGRADPTPEEIAAHQRMCSGLMRQVGEGRATLRNVDASTRAEREQQIAVIEAAYNKSCRGS
jgi:uncharacterized protein DUF4124